MHTSRIAGIVPVILLAACAHHRPMATVDVIDTSLSITPRAEQAALGAVGDQISRLGRGDRLVVIPITGDAQNDAPGRILRLQAPTVREPYDADLKRFRADAQKRFTAWAASLDPHPSHTDILGALDAARQEFAVLPMDYERRLLVVSDFLEDDCTYRFVSAGSLANASRARELAERVRAKHRFALEYIPFCLGRLESTDFAPLSAQRKEAIRAFWTAYFGSKGQTIDIHFDGAGIVSDAQDRCFAGKQ